MDSEEIRAQRANRVTWTGFLVNLTLTVFKLFAGIIGKSGAIIADAVHSLSDFITDIVVLISFRVTRKPIDREHDYGHGKFETLATTFIGLALLAVGFGILSNGGKKIYSCLTGSIIEKPGNIALIAAISSVIVKEWLYRYTVKVGKEITSQAVIANAWHHRSDAFSSIGTTIGVGGAILLGEQWRILDPIAAVIVSFFILKIGLSISIESIRELTEESLPDEIEELIMNLAGSVKGVIEPHDLRTRKIGNTIAVDLHIYVHKNLSIFDAHEISSNIEDKIHDKFGNNSFVSVHIEPYLPE